MSQDDEQISLVFLPYYKRDWRNDNNDELASTGRSYLDINIKIKLKNGNYADLGELDRMKVKFRGAGDVLGFNDDLILRLEPVNGSMDFEPNFFPFIEFKDPSFPWLYSIPSSNEEKNDGNEPWLSLIAISQTEIDLMLNEQIKVFEKNQNKQDFINIKLGFLPNETLFWSTASVQVKSTSNPQSFEDNSNLLKYILSNPEKCSSRIICFRKLEQNTDYTVILVPNYQLGVKAFFKENFEDDEDRDKKAWTYSENDLDTIIKLPIYYKWHFRTSDEGDFKKLARKLTPIVIDDPNKVGQRVVKIGLSSLSNLSMEENEELGSNNSSKEKNLEYFRLGGAITAPNFSNNLEKFKDVIQNLSITENLWLDLNESLQSYQDSRNEDDPLLTYPTYGKYFRKTTNIQMPFNDRWAINSPWIHELNLDVRYRVPAGCGTTVIQQNQDRFCELCWEQVNDLKLANDKIRLTNAGLKIGEVIEKKHLTPLTDERFTLTSTPFHSHLIYQNGNKEYSYKKAFKLSGIQPGVLSPAFKRIAHQKVGINNFDIFYPWRLAKSNDIESEKIKNKENCLPKRCKGEKDENKFKQLLFNLGMKEERYVNLKDYIGFNFDVYEQLPKKILIEEIDVGNHFRNKFDLELTLKNKLKNFIKFKNRSFNNFIENFEQIMVSPKINYPMYKYLEKLSLDFIIPGASSLDNNIISLCSENRKFIEAFMVGLNHEMGRELVWKGFPTDQRGTVFSYFWDPTEFTQINDENNSSTTSQTHTPIPHISKIHKWSSPLGQNPYFSSQYIPESNSQQNSLVLLIKGDLIRRYSDLIIYSIRITKEKNGRYCFWREVIHGNDREPSKEDSTLINPIFRGLIGSDILILGFPFYENKIKGDDKDGEYYFVLQENQSSPRFSQIDNIEWKESNKYIQAFGNQFVKDNVVNSASILSNTLRSPARVVIHVSKLIDLS
jgi:hypothetical protein